MEFSFNNKVNEYLKIGTEMKLFDSDNYEIIRDRVSGFIIEEDYNLPGDAQTIMSNGIKKIKINPRKMANKPYYFMDEVIFHELTHAANEIHLDLYVKKETGKILGYKKNIEDKRNRESYYNSNKLAKYPEWGFLLLDEAIAQKIAQMMVEYKYNRKIYEPKYLESNIYPKGIIYRSTFADYKEYEKPAEIFSKMTIGETGLIGLAYRSLKDSAIDKVLESIDHNELYDILGYMGNIAIAEYAANGKFTLANSEELRKKENVVKSFAYIRDRI